MRILSALLVLLPLTLSASPEAPWRADVRIKVTGCTSCAECRSSIRQISQAKSGVEKVEFKDNIVRFSYAAPAEVRVLDVARAIDGSELLRVKVARVELTVAGALEIREGRPFLVTSSTGQAWALSAAPEGLEPGRPCLVSGALEHWKDAKEAPSLSVQSVEAL